MANSPSAKKRARQADRRTAINKARRSLKAAQPEIMRGANKGVLHGNTASRKVSRLHHRVNAMTA
jgi:small subunit ribosomal protein S20